MNAVPILSSDPLFEDQAARTLMHALHGGADFGECITTMSRVAPGDADAWHREWTATADRVAALGDDAFARGHRTSAAEAWLRASNYYRTSYIFLYGNPVSAALASAFDREAAAFAKAAAAMEPPIAAVEIPFEGTTLPGYFVSGGDGTRPLLVCTNGYDSTVHEMYFAFAVAARKRGWHCLLFDGPGQGRALIKQGLFIRPDWEKVVRPVIDFALTLPGVDVRRIALSGWSFGGYLSLRAATGEPRLAALVSDPGLPGLADGMRAMFGSLPAEALADPLTADPALFAPYVASMERDAGTRWKFLQRGPMVHGVSSLQGYLAAALAFDTRGLLDRIACPAFIGCEESDPLARGAPAVYEALQCPKLLARFTAAEGAGDHCAMSGRSLFLARMFDWLDDTLKTGRSA